MDGAGLVCSLVVHLEERVPEVEDVLLFLVLPVVELTGVFVVLLFESLALLLVQLERVDLLEQVLHRLSLATVVLLFQTLDDVLVHLLLQTLVALVVTVVHGGLTVPLFLAIEAVLQSLVLLLETHDGLVLYLLVVLVAVDGTGLALHPVLHVLHLQVHQVQVVLGVVQFEEETLLDVEVVVLLESLDVPLLFANQVTVVLVVQGGQQTL